MDEDLEDVDVSDIEVSEDNPFLKAWFDGVSNGNHHPRNDECTEANVINMTAKNVLADKMPTEVMTKKLQDFKRLNVQFIDYDDHDEDELNRCFWECVSYVFHQT